jgi:hypothetical protein
MNKIIMEQKIIMEELVRMKNLMVTKRGTVISEQVRPELYFQDDKTPTPFGERMSGTYSEEVDAPWDAFIRQWPKKYSCVITDTKTGERFFDNSGDYLYLKDKNGRRYIYWNDGDKQIEYGLGGYFKYDCNTEKFIIPFPERQSEITKAYCSIVKGKIPSYKKYSDIIKNQPWNEFVEEFNISTDEINKAKSSCPKKTGKLNFTPNEKFPLRFMQKGLAIRNLQSLIGLKKPTGNFYTVTEKALADKMKSLGLTYDRNVGVTQNIFNKLRRPLSPVNTPKISTTTPTGIENIVNPGAAASGIIQK